ncbi:MAG TPA: fumarylacetoacetase [Flavobacteriales bacterium]|mgnify:FL=1|nr:fumarylacetoacetase [Flavobacteriales bacterium]HRE74503.1 fumarylacetoacetase [Flavobacteriales bacterium]HRJ34979.1 fumarylacetoacetase [Flavobacteriales bacterium]HRJ37840.1 fumarylacetoacetase [Flavobacteriales bacterium]
MNIRANDPNRRSWVEVPKGSDFPIQNLPFGVFKTQGEKPRVGVAIGNKILDLKALHVLGHLPNQPFNINAFDTDSLNTMMSYGKKIVREFRNRISDLLEENNPELRDNHNHVAQVLVEQAEAEMLLPVQIGDYTDFYSSIDHATNVGKMFRDPENALLPNWKHLPVGYHGRSSSIVSSGTAIHRPKGQSKAPDQELPSFGPCKLLDFELETGFFTFPGKPLGHSISTEEADEYIFGMVLLNDWSARDIQTWEYVPLGPFLAKNFASSISSWVVTLDALEPFRTKGATQVPAVLPYLSYQGEKNIDIHLEVIIQTPDGNDNTISNSNNKYMYWTIEQQLAHHTVNGCNIRCGDFLGSGTISGPTRDTFGSMLELTWKGTQPLKMKDGSERKFINDNDTVVMRGYCEKDGLRIGFGEVKTKVLPAI